MRRVLQAVLLLIAAVPPAMPPAMSWAQEPTQSAEIDAASQAVAASRTAMEQHYEGVAEQHATLRRLAADLRTVQRDGALPDWLTARRTVAAMRALAADARAGLVARVTDYRPLTAFVPASAAGWELWSDVLVERARAFAVLDRATSATELLAQSLLVVADTQTPAAWDGWFQDDAVVVEWRRANADLGRVRAMAAAAAPTVLVRIEKGRVEVGPWDGWVTDLSAKDNKRTKVSVKVLHVDRHEVTVGQFRAFLLAVDGEQRASLLPAGWELSSDGLPRAPSERADHPVTGVTFEQAAAYAESQGKRLPTEDEWEHIAADGDETRVYPWGSDIDGHAWVHRDEGGDATRGVTEYPDDATPAGVLGLAGNVKEMVATTSDRKPVKGRLRPDERIVVRGGGFRTRASECHTRWRWFIEAGNSADDVGFRCVMDDAEFKRSGPR